MGVFAIHMVREDSHLHKMHMQRLPVIDDKVGNKQLFYALTALPNPRLAR
jgi:hypothetical protein